MNIKLNWGQSIAIVLGLFVLFIGNFVYKTFTDKDYNHTLVSPEYYKEELYYQKEIDGQNNAAKLVNNITVNQSEKGLAIIFPSEFDFSKIKAYIELKRNSDDNLDIKKELILDSLVYLIPNKQLAPGRYLLKINWEYEASRYQYRQRIDY